MDCEHLPWDGFWQFVQKFFGYANRLLQQLSGWLVSDDLGGEYAGCGGPGLVWLHVVWSVVVRPNSLKRLWRRLMVEKWTSNSWATALVDIPAVRMPIACSFKTCNICGIVLCDKTAHFRVAFYCGQPIRHTCATIMLSNQHLDMPHLWGGWIISTKEKCSLTLTDLDRFVNNIWEK